ncbi:hypothetical protein [Streptomyces venezuelae]|uniref:hypothetical protein n=1 Tax=Streptomyces venezuelae TaxID=54571 RepID=UPI00351B07EB
MTGPSGGANESSRRLMVRAKISSAPTGAAGAWPVAHPVAGALLWSLALIALCAPLAVRRHTRG